MAVRGYVDGVIDGEVFGWAFDDERPGVRIRVSCTLDGMGLGTASAELMRDDVRAAGLGDGLSGFRLPIAAPLEPGTHTVEVREESTGEVLRLADDWIAVGEDGAPIDGVVLRSDHVAPGSTSAPASRELALVGAGTWLFALPVDGGEGPRGLARTSHSGLDADVEAVEVFHAAAAAVGAVGCAVEVPDKLQVYADHLPEGFSVDPDGRWARRLQARLRDSDVGGVLDLYDVLLDARIHGRVFPRSGRRLSWIGAAHAARAITRAVGVRPRPISAIDPGLLTPVEDSVEGLARVEWRDGALVPASGEPLSIDEEPLLELDSLPAGRSTGLIVHDASGERIARLLRDRFARVTVVEADGVAPGLMKREKPDVVVWIRGDRTG